MAKQALQLAKQAKLDRIQQHEQDDDDDDDDPQFDNSEHPEQAPETFAEEKKEDGHARVHNDENVELVHSFARQMSWVMGEEDTTAGLQMDLDVRSLDGPPRTRSLRRFLSKRSPRVSSSFGPRHGLAREASADF